MFVFIVKRLLWMLPFLIAISFLSFVLIQLPPGDYVTTYTAILNRVDPGPVDLIEKFKSLL